jgi:hypothetical protein
MAKTSAIEKNKRRRRMVAAHAPNPQRLKDIASDRTKKPQ